MRRFWNRRFPKTFKFGTQKVVIDFNKQIIRAYDDDLGYQTCSSFEKANKLYEHILSYSGDLVRGDAKGFGGYWYTIENNRISFGCQSDSLDNAKKIIKYIKKYQ
jgi:hypothetical protein